MSLEDETQQPAIAGSSQAPGGIGLHSSTNAGIMATLQQQYATAAPVHTTPLAPPSSDPPLVAATSELTQEPESEDSLKWESVPRAPPVASGGSLQHAVLAQIEEETQPPRLSEPPSASAKTSDDTDFLVSQTPEYANDSMREDNDDPSESEMSDIQEDGDDQDSVSVSTPPNSHPEAANAISAMSASLPQPPPSAPEQAMRPISSTPAAIPAASSPTRPLITPSRHAAQITTPTKKRNTASPSTPLKLLPDLSFKSPIAASTIKRPAPKKAQSDSRASRPRSPSPGESSDFARDMLPAPRKLSAQEQIDALFSNEHKSPESDKSSPTRRRPRPVWRTSSGPHRTSQSSPSKAQPSFEPTLLNDGEVRQVSSPVAGAQTTSPRAFYSSETQVDPVAGPSTSPTKRQHLPPINGSQTLLNTVRPLGSQTQLNSGSAASSPHEPPAAPARRLGHFASIPSSARAESPGLLFESVDEIEESDARSHHEESFVATQLNTIPPPTSSPPRRLAVGSPMNTTPGRSANVNSSGSVEFPPVGGYSFSLTACSCCNTHTAAPVNDPPAPSDTELEPTYVDPASLRTNDSVGSQDGAQAPASEPPVGIFPSSIERPGPVHRVASAPAISTPLFPPPSDDPMKGVEPPTTTPPNPMDEESEPSTLVPVVPPRRSPYKYGKRGGQRIPSTRAGMPRRRLPSETPAESAAEERHSSTPGPARNSNTATPPPASARNSNTATPSPASKKSDSSITTVDDPDDATFQDDGPVQASQPSPDPSTAPSPSPPADRSSAKSSKAKGKSKATPRASTTDGVSSRASSRPTRDKRKALSTSPEFSDESSDAPEDVEDYSYRPTKAGREKAKAAASRASSRPAKEVDEDEAATDADSEAASKPRRKTPSSKSSRQPPRKRSKTTTAATAVKTTRSRSAGRSPRVATTSVVDVVDGDSAPMRVLARWKNDQYYAGTVVGRENGGFKIAFDDGGSTHVAPDRLRALQLHRGDPVYDGNMGVYHVAEPYDGEGDVAVSGPRNKPLTIKSSKLVVIHPDIALKFGDRLVSREALEKRFPMGSPRQSLLSTAKVFEDKVFVVTGAKDKKADEVRKAIQHHGGTVATNWTDLFHITKSGHTLAGHRTPFVLQFGAPIMTPKFMAALAAGVPVLAGKYIEDAVERLVDWRAYLISPGESVLLGQPASQVVDPTWGETTWDAATAHAVRQPLAGMTVLYVYSKGSMEVKVSYRRVVRVADVQTLASFCLRAMGANVTMATELPSDFSAQDLVLVDDRVKAVTLTSAAKKSGRLVNVPWLKACLTAGAALSPALMRDGSRA